MGRWCPRCRCAAGSRGRSPRRGLSSAGRGRFSSLAKCTRAGSLLGRRTAVPFGPASSSTVKGAAARLRIWRARPVASTSRASGRSSVSFARHFRTTGLPVKSLPVRVRSAFFPARMALWVTSGPFPSRWPGVFWRWDPKGSHSGSAKRAQASWAASRPKDLLPHSRSSSRGVCGSSPRASFCSATPPGRCIPLPARGSTSGFAIFWLSRLS